MLLYNILDRTGIRIQLVNGRTPNEGKVEFLFPMRGAVCGSHWDDKVAKVACRMLGLP